MPIFPSDLTLEAAQQLCGGEKIRSTPGVRVAESLRDGYCLTSITITDEVGSEAMGRPQGRYLTIDLRPYFQRQEHFFPRGVRCMAQELQTLLPPLPDGSCVLVVGLGNRSMACDAVGPTAVDNLLVTRHMVAEELLFSSFRPVAAIATGVVGQTGVEAAQLIAGVVQQIHPAAVIVIDALCARSRQRLCATVQLSDTGLVPGSGVANHRHPIDQDSLGVPVLSVGIPTVIAGATLARELTGADAQRDDSLFVTPRDVDSRVRELGRLVGYGITAALQPGLTVEDISGLLG